MEKAKSDGAQSPKKTVTQLWDDREDTEPKLGERRHSAMSA